MSKTKISGKVLAVKLGREETQLVLMGKKSEVLYHTVVPTPEGAVEDGMIRNTDAVTQMLKDALKAPELKRVRQVVYSLCTSQVIAETVTTPILPESRLEKLLHANMDMYFPVDMKDYRLIWQVIGPKNQDASLNEQLVQLWAIPKAMAVRYYNVANACGLSVAALDYCGVSVASAVGASFAMPQKGRKKVNPAESGSIPGVTLHLTLEKDLLGMTFVQSGRVVMQRFIPCGADPFYQFGELAMILEYFHSMNQSSSDSITGVVSGSLSTNRELVEELSDVLGIHLGTLKSAFDPRMIMCIGAGTTTLDFGSPDMNKSGMAGRHVENHLWQYILVLLGGLAVVGVVMLLLSSRLMWTSAISGLKTMQQSLTIQAAEVNGYADNYEDYRSKYTDYSNDWDSIFANLRTYNDNLVLILQELEDLLPENVSVTYLQIAETGLVVNFACETKEEAAYLIMELREMQYAGLQAISNLGGGGSGAASSYGSEEPPTEGGDSISSSLIAESLDKEKVLATFLSLSDAEVDVFEAAYAKVPATQYATLADLKTAYPEEDLFEKRAAALKNMLSTNPFAADRFAELLEEDIHRKEPLLLLNIMPDLLKSENADMMAYFTTGKLPAGTSMQDMLDRLITILTKNERNLAATEALLCADKKKEEVDGVTVESTGKMEQWYVYELEVQLEITEADDYAFLDLDKMTTDLILKKSFDTGNTDLDAKLNALIPDSIWTVLDKIGGGDNEDEIYNGYTEAELKTMLLKYVTTGSTGDTDLDSKIKLFLTTGSTGDKTLDDLIASYLGNKEEDDGEEVYGGYTEKELKALMQEYLSTGTTGNTDLDSKIEEYLETGTTGNKTLDSIIAEALGIESEGDGEGDGEGEDDKKEEENIYGDYTESEMKMALLNYLMTGTTGDAYLDASIYLYRITGTTGDPKLDAILKAYLGTPNSGTGNNGSSGGSSGGSSQPVDTRVTLTVVLAYKEDLIKAELARKGLSYSDKIEGLEVGGE